MYKLSIQLVFENCALSKDELLTKIKGCVDNYASQSNKIYSLVPQGFSYIKIDPTAIKSSCQISSSTKPTPNPPPVKTNTYYANLTNILVLKCGCLTPANVKEKFKQIIDTV